MTMEERAMRAMRAMLAALPGAHDEIVIALKEMCDEARSLGADAVVGVDLDYETLGVENGMLMVSASGTAVKLR